MNQCSSPLHAPHFHRVLSPHDHSYCMKIIITRDIRIVVANKSKV
jgi:hypothetical protein